jgi:hypothetical protein
MLFAYPSSPADPHLPGCLGFHKLMSPQSRSIAPAKCDIKTPHPIHPPNPPFSCHIHMGKTPLHSPYFRHFAGYRKTAEMLPQTRCHTKPFSSVASWWLHRANETMPTRAGDTPVPDLLSYLLLVERECGRYHRGEGPERRPAPRLPCEGSGLLCKY